MSNGKENGEMGQPLEQAQAMQEVKTPTKRRNPANCQSDLCLDKRSLSEDTHFYMDNKLSIEQKLERSASFKPDFKGYLELVIGPMFAGKSTEMLRRVRRHAISGKSVLFVKYAADTRYDVACIATHDE